jgi:hypothetical protein
MRTFKVLHAKEPEFSVNPDDKFDSSKFTVVAEVTCLDIESAFGLTNHIHNNWEKNPECNVLSPRNRSTSVGDIIEEEDGAKFWCASAGWIKVQE